MVGFTLWFKRVILLFSFSLPYLWNSASAQIIESDTARFQLKLAVTGFLQTGNVEVLNLRSTAEGGIRLGKVAYFKSQNNFLYQEFSGFKADADIISQNFMYYKPHRKFYPYLLSFLSSNYRRGIEFRQFSGIGMTYGLLKSDAIRIKLSANTVYETNKYLSANYNVTDFNGNTKINTWRLSGYFDLGYQFKFGLIHVNYWIMPSLESNQLLRQQCDFSLSLKLYKRLNFLTNVRYTYESLVLRNSKNDDFFMGYGLQFNL